MRAYVVKRFERHTARKRSVAYHRNHVIIFVFKITGASHSESERKRCRAVSGREMIVLAFLGVRKSRHTLVGTERGESVSSTRDDFMRVRLMPDVENNLIVGRIENVMKRDGEFDRAEVRRQMPAAFFHDGKNVLAHFARIYRKLADRKFFKVGGAVHLFKQSRQFNSVNVFCSLRQA